MYGSGLTSFFFEPRTCVIPAEQVDERLPALESELRNSVSCIAFAIGNAILPDSHALNAKAEAALLRLHLIEYRS